MAAGRQRRVVRVVLVGQPNVGKSSLLNALTGARVQTSNYPGTTVEVTHARTVIHGIMYEFIDTPGIYNLYPSSLEEEVTERVIVEGNYDAAILVVDATALERGLLLLVALAELGVRLVVAVNFWEEAERRGIMIDYQGLERELGIPLVKVNPIKRRGLDELLEALSRATIPRIRIKYDDHIEEAIKRLEECVPSQVRLSRRGLAVRLLEGDPVVSRLYPCPRAEEERRRLQSLGHDPYLDIEAARAGVAMGLAARYMRIEVRSSALSRFDMLLLSNPLLGLASSLALVLGIILLVVAVGGWVIDVLDASLSPLLDRLLEAFGVGGLIGYVVSAVLNAVYAQYVAAIPYVFIFYLALVTLEDSGLLARAILWLHALTHRLGLHPKAVIPILLGLGCSVPAVQASRILPGWRQRLAVLAALAFVPCSSRAATIFAVAGRSLGAWAPLLVYLQGFVLGFTASAIVAKATGAASEAILVEDIPPLRLPRPGNVARKAWLRLRDFLLVVTPLVAAGAAAYAVLDYYGFVEEIVSPISPLARLLGLPPELIIPLAYGFLQKDLTVAMMATVLGTHNFSAVLSPRQILVFTMATTYQIPCIAALLMAFRELGVKRSLPLVLALDAAGYLVALLYAHVQLPL